LRAAAVMPDRVERVVLAGCPAFVPPWKQPRFFTLLRTPLLGRLLLAAPVTRASVRMALRQLGHARSLRAGRIPPVMLAWERAWQRDTETLRNDAAMIVELETRRDGFDTRLDVDADALRAVRSPCLVLVGTDDPIGAEPVARTLASSVPSATVEVFEGFGHLPWLDDPAVIAERVVAFVHGSQAETSRSSTRPTDAVRARR
jgi:pimeloyl-ACP methyl ester carboxylesterase